jgi:methyl-accepting chemotaxis protein
MTIRAKLLLGSLCLILTVVALGAYSIYGVNRISALMTQTYDGALMASVHASQAHTNFIKLDRALRRALTARTVDEFDRHVTVGESAAADVLSDLDVVAERTWNAESAQLVNEIKILIGDKKKARVAVLPGLRQQLADNRPVSVPAGEPVMATAAAAGTDTTSPAPAQVPPAGGKAPAEDSGVQIVRRKSADGKVTSPSPSGRQVPEVAAPASGAVSASPRTLPGVPQTPTQVPAPTVAAAPAPIPATPAAPEGSTRVPQVGGPARVASQSPDMARVPQVGGKTSPAGSVVEMASPPAVAALASSPAALFEGSERIEDKLRILADRATEAGYVFRESSRRIGRTILGVTIGALVAAVLIGVAAVFLFSRWIASPLRQVSQRLHNLVVGQGTLEERLAATRELPVESADEIGQLRASLNATVTLLRQREAEVRNDARQEQELQKNIGSFLSVAHEIAQGDLTRRGAVSGDMLGRVVTSINSTVEKLGSTIRDVQEASQRVSANARDMIVTSEQLAKGAQAQSREATNAASALEGVTRSVRQVAGNATASATAARRALEAAQEGDQAVRRSLEGMEGIRLEVAESTKKLKRLVDRSKEISDVLKTVQNLASQTDILARNATIEAAGAGAAGVRFAAVASQIRQLADLASQAAKDVGPLIHAVQQETQAASAAIEQGTQRMEAGYQVSRQASERLQEIATISRESAGLAQDISIATQEQVRGTEGVATAVKLIAGFAVKTDESAAQARRTIESLAGLAEELRAKLSQFKVAV